MTRPLGYSVERQDDGRVRIIRTLTCWRCLGIDDARCIDCHGERCVDSSLVVSAERARALRDALTTALGETSERAKPTCATCGHTEDLHFAEEHGGPVACFACRDGCTAFVPPEVPAASVASEGAARCPLCHCWHAAAVCPP